MINSMSKPNPTNYARRFENLLRKLGIKVEEEVFDGHKHIDLSVEGSRLDIEVDGIQHLTDPKQIITDFERSNHSRDDGYETIHVHNIDLECDAEHIAEAIAKVSEIREEAFDVMANIKEEKEEEIIR